jgi:hypothetical protein
MGRNLAGQAKISGIADLEHVDRNRLIELDGLRQHLHRDIRLPEHRHDPLHHLGERRDAIDHIEYLLKMVHSSNSPRPDTLRKVVPVPTSRLMVRFTTPPMSSLLISTRFFQNIFRRAK